MGAAEMGDSLAMRATVEQGDSGSPVLRSRTGEVVGLLISREAPDPAGFSYQAYALPVELFREWLDRPDPAGDDFYLLRAAGRAGAP
jgi:V8-like Glu-specific endopeptidase